MQYFGPRPPGNGKGRSTRPPRMSSPRRIAVQADQSKTRTRTTNHSARIVARAQAVVDRAALLALDVAAIAAESGRGDHARAGVDLLECAHHAWIAAEVLAEGATI